MLIELSGIRINLAGEIQRRGCSGFRQKAALFLNRFKIAALCRDAATLASSFIARCRHSHKLGP
jgi:hypothetical protein